MANHQESHAKQATRLLLRDACERLQRRRLTYLGLPSNEAIDIKVLGNLLENVICVEEKLAILEETRRTIAAMPLKIRKFENNNIWNYLREDYPKETLAADVAFLDFYGGGIRRKDPFAEEIAGLRSYFAKHARYANRAFVFAWTYMPRDSGKNHYIATCEKLISPSDLCLLTNSSGVQTRSIAIRMLLRQSLREHGMFANLYQHALYKRIMNTIILVYSKGYDPSSRIELSDPDTLLTEPVCVYEPDSPVPQFAPLISAPN